MHNQLIFSFLAISVKFVPASYEVTEGEIVTFNVSLSSKSDSNVTVDFTTLDGSASGMDRRDSDDRDVWQNILL